MKFTAEIDWKVHENNLCEVWVHAPELWEGSIHFVAPVSTPEAPHYDVAMCIARTFGAHAGWVTSALERKERGEDPAAPAV